RRNTGIFPNKWQMVRSKQIAAGRNKSRGWIMRFLHKRHQSCGLNFQHAKLPGGLQRLGVIAGEQGMALVPPDKIRHIEPKIIITRDQQQRRVDIIGFNDQRSSSERPFFSFIMAAVFDKDGNVPVFEKGRKLQKILLKNLVRRNNDRDLSGNTINDMTYQRLSRERQEGFGPLFRERPETSRKTSGKNEGSETFGH